MTPPDEGPWLGLELPEDLRAEVLACATEKQISLEWLVKLYRRGYNAKLGATGTYPYGQMDPSDEGELTVAIAPDVRNGVVRMVFGKPVSWVALPAPHARRLAQLLTEHADTLDRKKH